VWGLPLFFEGTENRRSLNSMSYCVAKSPRRTCAFSEGSSVVIATSVRRLYSFSLRVSAWSLLSVSMPQYHISLDMRYKRLLSAEFATLSCLRF
jgi:hypothetical protein